MTDIIDILKEPEAHYPGNFDTPKRANAMLSCLCQEAAEEIEALRQQLAEKDALRQEVKRMESALTEWQSVFGNLGTADECGNEWNALISERDALRREVDALRREAGRIIAEQSRDITKVLRDFINNTDDCRLRVKAAEEIEALRSEVERLSRMNSSYSNLAKAQEGQLTALRNRLYELKGADKTLDSERDANAILTEQLAASQAREQQLREALHYSLGAWHYDGVSEEHGSIFQEASYRCDSPADTTALQYMIAKAGEVMRDRCAKNIESQHIWVTSVAASRLVRSTESVTLDDLK